MSVQGDLQYSKFSDKLRQEIIKELLALAEHLTGVFQQNVSVGSTGNLRGSFGYGITEQETGIALQVGTPVEYGQYVEFGTKPHWVPIDPLIRWVNAKLESFAVQFENPESLKTRKRVATGKKREKMVERIAYVIQQKIAKRGTEGKKYMEKSLKEMGLSFSVDARGSSIVYQVDLEKYLRPRMLQLMDRAGVKL